MVSNVSRQVPQGMVRKVLTDIQPRFVFDLEEEGFLLGEAEALAMKVQAEAELAALAPPVGMSSDEAAQVLTDMREAWGSFTREEQREAVCITIKSVSVDVRNGGVVGLEPRPAFEPLFAVVAQEPGGVVGFCDWRPRADSGWLNAIFRYAIAAEEDPLPVEAAS